MSAVMTSKSDRQTLWLRRINTEVPSTTDDRDLVVPWVNLSYVETASPHLVASTWRNAGCQSRHSPEVGTCQHMPRLWGRGLESGV